MASDRVEEEMPDAANLLQQLGFSEYEARAYVTLLQHDPLNGYELAKASGIPRPNIYAILQKLEKRQAVMQLTTSSGTRFAAIAPAELIQRLSQRFERTLAAAHHSLNEIGSLSRDTFVRNIQGYAALIEEAKKLIEAAQQQVFLAIWLPEARALAELTAQAEARGVRLTTLCWQACPEVCGSCRGRIYRYHLTPEQPTRWLMVLTDEQEIVLGTIEADATLALHTRQPGIVEVAGGYIRHSIALAAILTDLDGRVDASLSPRTRELLRSTGWEEQGSDWLEHMLELLKGRA